MKIPTRNQLYLELNTWDTGFYDLKMPDQHGFSKMIWLLSKNENGPWLELKIDNKAVKISNGEQLKKNEKNKCWEYLFFDSLEELVENIVDFTARYSDDFEQKVTRKSK